MSQGHKRTLSGTDDNSVSKKQKSMDGNMDIEDCNEASPQPMHATDLESSQNNNVHGAHDLNQITSGDVIEMDGGVVGEDTICPQQDSSGKRFIRSSEACRTILSSINEYVSQIQNTVVEDRNIARYEPGIRMSGNPSIDYLVELLCIAVSVQVVFSQACYRHNYSLSARIISDALNFMDRRCWRSCNRQRLRYRKE